MIQDETKVINWDAKEIAFVHEAGNLYFGRLYVLIDEKLAAEQENFVLEFIGSHKRVWSEWKIISRMFFPK